MCEKIIVLIERKLNPLVWGGGLVYKDANLNPYWSHGQHQLPHFSAPLIPLPGPKHPLFPHPIYTCERLTDKDDLHILDSSLI
jgi:hypothetical protein